MRFIFCWLGLHRLDFVLMTKIPTAKLRCRDCHKEWHSTWRI